MPVPYHILVAVVVLSFMATGCASRLERRDAQRNDFAIDLAAASHWDEAAFHWEKLLERYPDNAKILNNAGIVALEEGRYEDAKELFERSLDIAPTRRVRKNLETLSEFLDYQERRKKRAAELREKEDLVLSEDELEKEDE